LAGIKSSFTTLIFNLKVSHSSDRLPRSP